MDRQAAADFWQRRPPPLEPTHSRIYGGRSAGLPGTNSYWDNEAQRDLTPPPTKALPLGDRTIPALRRGRRFSIGRRDGKLMQLIT